MSQNDQRSRNHRTPSSNAAYRATTGTVAELYFASMMLSNGYDVYQPLVDVKIDYLVKSWNNRELRFQCKSRTSLDEYGFELTLPADQNIKCPTHLFLMLGALPDPDFWIVPYDVFKKHSKKVMVGEKKALRLIVSLPIQAILEKYKKQDGLQKLRDWCVDEETEESA